MTHSETCICHLCLPGSVKEAHSGSQQRIVQRNRNDWARGYFCAVAILLHENFKEGVSGTETDSLFKQGGDWRDADAQDIETFRKHGLIPLNSDYATGVHILK